VTLLMPMDREIDVPAQADRFSTRSSANVTERRRTQQLPAAQYEATRLLAEARTGSTSRRACSRRG